jgi:hypothetical protein
MAYEQRDNTGTIFRNDRREKDSQPNARGTALIEGVEYEISAWTKQGQKGPFQSLSFKRKEQRQPEAAPRSSSKPVNSYGVDDDGDLPF